MMIDENTEPEWMQNIALEMNLSETAFIIHNGGFFKIRYFTPEREVPLYGHATLASAHIIYETGILGDHEVIIFKAEGGDLTVSRESDWIKMNFPEYPLKKINPIKAFKDTIGFEPVEMYSSLYDWIIAVAKSPEEIIQAKPDFETMKRNGLGHLIITAKSELNSFQLSKRTGILRVKQIDNRVEIWGKAITIFRAELKI
ncbi:MAG: PhzF family phenazine biosynthesis protein [Bacteroidales bacterium]|nr:PhzF family phenazine biosynthesis protein [Bacteroidales bacterium]